MEWKGRWVRFAVRDIYHPTPDEVLDELYGDGWIAGEVVDVSDGGAKQEAFVVVKVQGIERPVVVALERVRDWR